MFKPFICLSFLLISFQNLAQYGGLELSSGGFSFIPAFTSREPNLILTAGSNPKKKLSINMLYLVRVRSFTPNTMAVITRYRFLDRKVKASLGIHIPAMQMKKDYSVTSFFGQELNISYPLSNQWQLGGFVLNGRGRNSDFKAAFFALNATQKVKKWEFTHQTYYLDAGRLNGVAETINYSLSPHLQARGFSNYTLTDGNFIATIGLKYLY